MLRLLFICLLLPTTPGLAGPLAERICALLQQPLPHTGSKPAAVVRRVYRQQKCRPMWIRHGRLTTRAEQILDVLRGAPLDGLDPGAYGVPWIRSRPAGGRLAATELAISQGLYDWSRDVAYGRAAPAARRPDLFFYPPPATTDFAGLVQNVRQAGDLRAWLGRRAPAHRFYAGLRRALERLRRLEADGGWPLVRRSLRPGDRHPAVRRLQRRLFLAGDYRHPDPGSGRFHPLLKKAVQGFQRRHGLHADGVVGRRTLAALDVTVQERMAAVALNMERWRWLRRDPGNDHVMINLASYRLQLVQKRRPVLDMRVVVGGPGRHSPVFSGRINRIEFNPVWHIPRSIILEDYAAALRGPGAAAWLRRRGIRIYAGPGARALELPVAGLVHEGRDLTREGLWFRQDPGPMNPLGMVKFMFPNPFAVYLHDTNDRPAFRRADRAGSHGCIRLQRPGELATLLLNGDGERRTEAGLRRLAREHGGPLSFSLKKPVPVHLTYQTAWVDDADRLHFRADVYGRDRILQDLLRPARAAVHAAR